MSSSSCCQGRAARRAEERGAERGAGDAPAGRAGGEPGQGARGGGGRERLPGDPAGPRALAPLGPEPEPGRESGLEGPGQRWGSGDPDLDRRSRNWK